MPPVRVLIDEATLAARIRDLAAELRRRAPEPPYPCMVLEGARPFARELCRALALDPEACDRVRLSSYADGTESSGKVRLLEAPRGDLRGRRVVVLEDIVDTGRSMAFLRPRLEALGAASVEVWTLLDKPSRRVVDVRLDGVGFEIPDRFVVGFGLDLGGRFRDLPYVGVVDGGEAAAALARPGAGA
ncbi:MAG: phosphoribosyltransferase family protein [Planctomycetota bacterium]